MALVREAMQRYTPHALCVHFDIRQQPSWAHTNSSHLDGPLSLPPASRPCACACVAVALLLQPMLARGELRCIGATTLGEYRQHIEKDAAFERRFQQVGR